MTAQDLLREFSSLAVEITTDGDLLRWKAPPGAMTLDLLARLRTLKPELLRILKDGTPTEWPSDVPPWPTREGCHCALCSPREHGFTSQIEAAKAAFGAELFEDEVKR